MKRLVSFLMVAALCLNFTSCKDDENVAFVPELTWGSDVTSPITLVYEAKSDIEASFTGNVSWTAKVDIVSGEANWLTLSSGSEKGNSGDNTIRFNVTENDEEDTREATITVTADGYPATSIKLTVKQVVDDFIPALEEDEEADLATFVKEGEVREFTFYSNVAWKAEVSEYSPELEDGQIAWVKLYTVDPESEGAPAGAQAITGNGDKEEAITIWIEVDPSADYDYFTRNFTLTVSSTESKYEVDPLEIEFEQLTSNNIFYVLNDKDVYEFSYQGWINIVYHEITGEISDYDESFDFKFQAPTEWEIEVEYDEEDPLKDWITVSETTGAAAREKSVEISADANAMFASREAKVWVRSKTDPEGENMSTYITIKQEQANAHVTFIEPTSGISSGYLVGSHDVVFTTSLPEYEIYSSVDWITIKRDGKEIDPDAKVVNDYREQRYTIEYPMNLTLNNRSGYIYVRTEYYDESWGEDRTIRQQLSVLQRGQFISTFEIENDNALNSAVTRKNFAFDIEGKYEGSTSVTVPFYTSYNWSTTVPTDFSWVKINNGTGASGSGDMSNYTHSVTVSADPNPYPIARTASITIVGEGEYSGKVLYLTVTQPANGTPSLELISASPLDLPYNGGTVEIKFKANLAWTIQANVSNIVTFDQASGEASDNEITVLATIDGERMGELSDVRELIFTLRLTQATTQSETFKVTLEDMPKWDPATDSQITVYAGEGGTKANKVGTDLGWKATVYVDSGDPDFLKVSKGSSTASDGNWTNEVVYAKPNEYTESYLWYQVADNNTSAEWSGRIVLSNEFGYNDITYNISNIGNAGNEMIAIPDAVFQSELRKVGVTITDGKVRVADALKVTTLEMNTGPNSSQIKSLEGIQAFKNLEVLRFAWHGVSSIDLTGLTKLTLLEASDQKDASGESLTITKFWTDPNLTSLREFLFQNNSFSENLNNWGESIDTNFNVIGTVQRQTALRLLNLSGCNAAIDELILPGAALNEVYLDGNDIMMVMLSDATNLSNGLYVTGNDPLTAILIPNLVSGSVINISNSGSDSLMGDGTIFIIIPDAANVTNIAATGAKYTRQEQSPFG